MGPLLGLSVQFASVHTSYIANVLLTHSYAIGGLDIVLNNLVRASAVWLDIEAGRVYLHCDGQIGYILCGV